MVTRMSSVTFQTVAADEGLLGDEHLDVLLQLQLQVDRQLPHLRHTLAQDGAPRRAGRAGCAASGGAIRCAAAAASSQTAGISVSRMKMISGMSGRPPRCR
jgi:hypothetical protein